METIMAGTGKERLIMTSLTVGCAAIALGGAVGLGVLEKKRTDDRIALAKARGQTEKWQNLERRRARMSHATVAATVNAR
jgi:hypothetical protein